MERLVAQLGLQRAPLGHVPGEHADETGQPSQDQQRQERRPDRDHRQATGRLWPEHDQDRAGDHRRRKADHPDRPEPGDGDGTRFGQDAHRGMGSRGAEQDV